MPPKRTPAKTAPVAVALPVAPVADEEPEEVASQHLCSTCGEMLDVIGETECLKCQTPPVVPDDEPSEDESEDEEEDDEEVMYMKTRKATLTEQIKTNTQRWYDSISGKVGAIKDKREALQEQIRAYDTEILMLNQTAHDKACEENKAVQIKLDKVLAFLGEAKARRTPKTAERKASGEVVKAKSSTFFSRKPLNEMVNQNTRFIYEQKKGCVFKRFCLISKSENCVYECDENGTRKGVAFRSLNDFCVMVKKSVNYQGSLKQDTSVVLKYYDISSQEYRSYKDLTSPLN
jgi:hypothetical protein